LVASRFDGNRNDAMFFGRNLRGDLPSIEQRWTNRPRSQRTGSSAEQGRHCFLNRQPQQFPRASRWLFGGECRDVGDIRDDIVIVWIGVLGNEPHAGQTSLDGGHRDGGARSHSSDGTATNDVDGLGWRHVSG
jgi:hypothetical protein